MLADMLRRISTEGVSVEVGSFVKQTAVGNQDVPIATDLTDASVGSWAVIFWMAGSDAASGTLDPHAAAMVGMAANGGGSISQYAVGTFQVDSVGSSDTQRRGAAKCITSIDSNAATVPFEAEMGATPFPSSASMRINWTTNTAAAPHANNAICYAIISGLAGAEIVTWTSPAGASKSVTGVGFQPDLVLHVGAVATATPQTNTNALLSIGVMNSAGEQWSSGFSSADAEVAANSFRHQRTDSCFAQVNASGTEHQRFTFASMDADGFTVNTPQTSANDVQGSLCLAGVSSKIGSFAKSVNPVTPVTQDIVAGLSFSPLLGLFTGTGIAGDPSGSLDSEAAWWLGGTDGTNERVAAMNDRDAADPTQVYSLFRDDRSMAAVNAGPSVRIHGDVALGTTSTVTWQQNDATADEILYLLVG